MAMPRSAEVQQRIYEVERLVREIIKEDAGPNTALVGWLRTARDSLRGAWQEAGDETQIRKARKK